MVRAFLKVRASWGHSPPGGMKADDGPIALVASAADGESDAQWAQRCCAGDNSAWRALYHAHWAQVVRTARSLGTPLGEVEDVAHEVFMVVHRKLSDFDHGRLSTWIYRITANVVSAQHRRRKVRRRFTHLARSLGLRVAAGEGPRHPGAAVEQADDVRTVHRVLERMSPRKREVFALFELEGKTGPEIAELVGVPENTVWSRLRTGREEFARIAGPLVEDA